MTELRTGTLTFLMTDIEGSVRLWEEMPSLMAQAQARHDALVEEVVAIHHGDTLKRQSGGDGAFAVFRRATDAIAAADALQLRLAAESWPTGISMDVRIAVNTGEAYERDGDYFGPVVNRCARILRRAQGMQTLVSRTTYDLVRDELPGGVHLQSLGSPELKGLQRREEVFQLVRPGLHTPAPPRSLDPFPSNLPVQLSSFVGRQRELQQLAEQLTSSRLITLIGPAGVGKSRLVTELGKRALDNYADGVWFIALASVNEPSLVPQAVASPFALRNQPESLLIGALKEHFRERRMLLILDNCEHLIGAVAVLTDALLRNSTYLVVMATSRQPLNIDGERVFEVPALSAPAVGQSQALLESSQWEAPLLFVERARSKQPSLKLAKENAASILEICLRLDCLPLAIELAAARVNALSTQEIAAMLDDRLSLLTHGSSLDERHGTLRAALDWSYQLLPADEQALFAQLSVFAGGFTLASFEAICRLPAGRSVAETRERLFNLLDKSLVVAEHHSNRVVRYKLLETVREYARDRLSDPKALNELHRRYADHFRTIADEAEAALRGPEQSRWLDSLEVEHDNLRGVLDWLEAVGERDEALLLAGALWRFWRMRGHGREGRQRLARLLSAEGHPVSARAYAKALNAAGTLAYDEGDYQAARLLLERSLAYREELGDPAELAIAQNNLAGVARQQGDYDLARSLWEKSLETRRALGDQRAIATILNNLGLTAHDQGDYVRAESFYLESLSTKQALGDDEGVAVSLENLGDLSRERGDFRSARRYLERSLTLWRTLANAVGIATSTTSLGMVERDVGELELAGRLLTRSVRVLRRLGSQYALATALEELAVLRRLEGRISAARRLLRESSEIRTALGHRQGIAFVEHQLGLILCAEGDSARARSRMKRGLEIRAALHHEVAVADSLEGFAALAASSSEARRAIVFFESAQRLRSQIGAPTPPSLLTDLEAQILSSCRRLGEEETVRARLEAQTMDTAAAVRYALAWQ